MDHPHRNVKAMAAVLGVPGGWHAGALAGPDAPGNALWGDQSPRRAKAARAAGRLRAAWYHSRMAGLSTSASGFMRR